MYSTSQQMQFKRCFLPQKVYQSRQRFLDDQQESGNRRGTIPVLAIDFQFLQCLSFHIFMQKFAQFHKSGPTVPQKLF